MANARFWEWVNDGRQRPVRWGAVGADIRQPEREGTMINTYYATQEHAFHKEPHPACGHCVWEQRKADMISTAIYRMAAALNQAARIARLSQ